MPNYIKIHIALIIIFLLSFLNSVIPVLRFENIKFNYYYFLIIVIAIPVLLLLNGLKFSKTPKIINSLILLIPILLSIIFTIFIYYDLKLIKDDYDPSFEKIKSFQFDNNFVNVYRTNGGATTDFGIIVRNEREIFPGILLVKKLYSEYHRYKIEAKKIGNNTIQIENEKYKVNNFVYF